jgi:hypothetical protein
MGAVSTQFTPDSNARNMAATEVASRSEPPE